MLQYWYVRQNTFWKQQLMSIFIMLLRLLSLLLFNLFCVFLVIIFYYILPKKIWIYFIKMWAFVTISIIGIKIITDNKNPSTEKNSMVIANHISWIDIPILFTQYQISFIGRSELRKWPLVNLLIKSAGTIFINRERKLDLIYLNKRLSKELVNGATIGLFPEGKTGNGLILQPFKPGLLESAITAKSTIIPLVIKYYTLDGKITTKVTYEGNITLWQSLKNSLLLNGIIVRITSLPRIDAGDFESRYILSNYLYAQMNTYLIRDSK